MHRTGSVRQTAIQQEGEVQGVADNVRPRTVRSAPLRTTTTRQLYLRRRLDALVPLTITALPWISLNSDTALLGTKR